MTQVMLLKIQDLILDKSSAGGKVEYRGDIYDIKIKGDSKNTIKIPQTLGVNQVLVRISGNHNATVEEHLSMAGRSDQIEIVSDELLDYIERKGTKFHTLELMF